MILGVSAVLSSVAFILRPWVHPWCSVPSGVGRSGAGSSLGVLATVFGLRSLHCPHLGYASI